MAPRRGASNRRSERPAQRAGAPQPAATRLHDCGNDVLLQIISHLDLEER